MTRNKTFFKMGFEQRRLVKEHLTFWLHLYANKKDEIFLQILKYAVENVNYDYWIATIEPTIVNGKLCYTDGKDIAVGFEAYEYDIMAKEYLPSRNSRLATIYELFMWYAWRICSEYVDFSYVSTYFANISNLSYYMENPHLETPSEMVGGFKDGQGRTLKLVTYKNKYVYCGFIKTIFGNVFPVPSSSTIKNPTPTKPGLTKYCSCGVVVFTKN